MGGRLPAGLEGPRAFFTAFVIEKKIRPLALFTALTLVIEKKISDGVHSLVMRRK